MTANEDLYAILQISPSASPEVVEAAYLGLTKKYGADSDPLVRERRRDLDRAYSVLSDRAKRAEYYRRNGFATSSAAAPVPSEPVTTWPKGIVNCPRDPGVETVLRCSRCETPICPKCMIQTPVGARCRDCAKISKSPIYTVDGVTAVKAGVAAVVGGLVMGLVWLLVLLPFTNGFLSIFVGAGLGWTFTRMMEVATGRKRGPVVVGFAIAGLALAWGMQLLFLDVRFAMQGLLAVGVAVYFAYQSLR